MRIDIITLFPELLSNSFEISIIRRAIRKKKVEIFFHNLRDFSKNKYKQVDDYPYGGGSGMVLMIEPIFKCINKLKSERNYDEIIYLTPEAKVLDQKMANTCSLKENIIILCGHYKGIDQRVRDHLISLEVSIGKYVMSGGELAAAVFCDSIIRLIPGVLGNESSALNDSFQDNIIAPPIYTRPASFNDWKVPKILLSGDQKKIEKWREIKSTEKTIKIKHD
ncbi:MAG: tRNA (guanosine(37)-N1)-methyltransferase TrmD [Flavobacteriaceae bacterium]|nr:tRNA (guanosine(37)-N1)-methyltransferase TrmD [Flavobacteriaceae bacterium]